MKVRPTGSAPDHRRTVEEEVTTVTLKEWKLPSVNGINESEVNVGVLVVAEAKVGQIIVTRINAVKQIRFTRPPHQHRRSPHGL